MTRKTINRASDILHLFSEKLSEQIEVRKVKSTIKRGQRNEAKKEEPEKVIPLWPTVSSWGTFNRLNRETCLFARKESLLEPQRHVNQSDERRHLD
jgi:hypothetical protein